MKNYFVEPLQSWVTRKLAACTYRELKSDIANLIMSPPPCKIGCLSVRLSAVAVGFCSNSPFVDYFIYIWIYVQWTYCFICLPVCLSVCLSSCMSVCVFSNMFICLSVSNPDLPNCLSDGQFFMQTNMCSNQTFF